MKIACVDKAASDRIKLQRFFDEAFEQSRNVLGHLTFGSTYPASVDEVLINSSPDVVAVGPGYSVEEAYSVCRKISSAHESATILLILSADNYSLRTLRRFHKICSDVFSLDEPKARLLHRLASVETDALNSKAGKLILVDGVKGGVGTTTIAAALAHAAEAVGKSAVVIDLSQMGSLIHYMLSQRWQSPDFATALVDGISPDKGLVERCLTTAPNGVTMMLPPSGGSDIRELWLRDPERFEITLTAVEILKDLFDVVLVDAGGAEGVLYFALATRAHSTLLVTSNDPASVHLLNSKLSYLAALPGESQLHILINQLVERGLTKEDIIDFLHVNDAFSPAMAALEPIPFAPHARHWIGTGNTFYTESQAATQQILEEALGTALLTPEEFEHRQLRITGLFAGLKRLAMKVTKRRERIEGRILALPFPRWSQNDGAQNGAESSEGAGLEGSHRRADESRFTDIGGAASLLTPAGANGTSTNGNSSKLKPTEHRVIYAPFNGAGVIIDEPKPERVVSAPSEAPSANQPAKPAEKSVPEQKQRDTTILERLPLDQLSLSKLSEVQADQQPAAPVVAVEPSEPTNSLLYESPTLVANE